MVDRGPLFRRALSWLPAQFASQSDAPVGAPRRFGSTEHLSTEAIAAYVDGELRMKSTCARRASSFAVPAVRAGGRRQSQARTALRDSRPITTPSTLFHLLAQIPEATPEEQAAPAPDRR